MEKKHVLATTTEKESEGWRKRSATTAGLGGRGVARGQRNGELVAGGIFL